MIDNKLQFAPSWLANTVNPFSMVDLAETLVVTENFVYVHNLDAA